MDSRNHQATNPTAVTRKSDRELVVTRTFEAPAHTVFEAWTRPELFRLWWAPKSMGAPLSSCEMDVRVGGGYRMMFDGDAADSAAFFGTYREVSAPARLVWTNEESDDAPLTTVTFADDGGRTILVLSELYASAEPLDAAIAGMKAMASEQFEQLDALLATLRTDADAAGAG